MHLLKQFVSSPRERRRLLLFAAVGASGVVVNNGVLWLLVEYTSLAFYFCSFIAIEASIVSNFLFNDNLTWHDKKRGSVFVRLLRYNVSTAFSSLIINMAVLLFLKEWVGLQYLVANIVGIGTATIFNFVSNTLWTYGTWRFRLPRVVWVVLIGSLLIRLLLAVRFVPGFDEAYYFADSVNPSLSYFDHPPLVGFLAGFFPYLTGITSALTIRLGAVLLCMATALLVFLLARESGDRKTGAAAFLLINLLPIFMVGTGVLIQPDAGLAFAWAGALLFLWRILVGGRTDVLEWVGAGVFAGLAMLAKYQGVLLLVLAALFVIIYQRHLLRTKGPYLFALIVALFFSPVLVWNAQHGSAFRALWAGRVSDVDFSPVRLLFVLGGQFVYLTPLVFFALMWVAWQTVRNGIVGGDRRQQFWFVFGTLPVALLVLISMVYPVLPHGTLPGYITLIVPLAVLIVAHAHKWWMRPAAYANSAVVLLLLLVAYLGAPHGILPVQKRVTVGGGGQEKPVAGGVAGASGWKEIARCLQKHELSPDSVFLVTHKWFLGGQLSLATEGRYVVRCFGPNPRGFGVWAREHSVIGKDAVCVTTDRYPLDVARTYRPFFERIELLDSIDGAADGGHPQTIYLHRCRRLLRQYPLLF